MSIIKKDYSNECTHDDDKDPRCWSCTKFLFPIGCMIGEEQEIEKTSNTVQSSDSVNKESEDK